MKVKLWHFLFFLFIVITATLVVFPNKKDLASIYIETGMVEKAGYTLHDLLEKNPDDVNLLLLSSKLYLLEGKPVEAINALKHAAKLDPGNVVLLTKLATLYESNRNPRRALTVLEKIAAMAPQESKTFDRLIDYYRYYGHLKKESDVIARVIHLERKFSKEQTVAGPLLSLINRELYDLIKKEDKGENPILDTLISGLYLLRKQYMQEIEASRHGNPNDPANTITRCSELFIRSGQIAKAVAFASKVDQMEGRGTERRLKLVQIMRWNGMDKRALALLSKLNEAARENADILLTMARIGEENGDLVTAIQAFEKLVKNEPDQLEYKEHLASLYTGSGAPRKAYRVYRELSESSEQNTEYLTLMITSAVSTGDIDLEAEAMKIAGIRRPQDPDIIRRQADLYLNLNKPIKAYPLYRQLTILSGGKKADVQKMLEVAESTNDLGLIKASLSEAINLRPKDPDVLASAGTLYLRLNYPDQAYGVYRRLCDLSGGKRDAVRKMLEAAGHTAKRETMVKAIGLALTFRPRDRQIAGRAAEMYLWIDMPQKAYELYKKIALWSGGKKQKVSRMIEVAESTGSSALLQDALLLGRKLRPRDAVLGLKVAEFFLNQGDEVNAIKGYANYLKLNPQDQKASGQLAKLYLWTNQPEHAYHIYKRLYRDHPGDPTIQAQLIELASWTNRPEEAAKFLGNISERDPKNFEKTLAAGNAFIDAGIPGKGIAFLERASRLKPDQLSIRKRLAEAYRWAGLTEKMTTELEYLYSMGQLEGGDRVYLAEVYLDSKDGTKALDLLGQLEAAKKIPRRGGIMLATAYELMGKRAASTRIFKRLYRENLEDPKFLTELGNQALWQNRTELALQVFEHALKEDPKNLTALKGSAQIYAFNNKPLRAIRRFETYNRLNPNDYEVRYQLGELYFTSGREGEALREYKKTLELINSTKAARIQEALGQKQD